MNEDCFDLLNVILGPLRCVITTLYNILTKITIFSNKIASLGGKYANITPQDVTQNGALFDLKFKNW